ncbi:NAD-dependent epimerase/dehydratase family protein [Parasphingorhabdus pacifica]
MRILVLGGTSFLSQAVASEAVRRGHDVQCAARGRSGTVPDGARLVSVDRDEPDELRKLAGERFDAVVDVATMSLPWVRDALATLGDHAPHWTFVSSINAYSDTATKGQAPGAPVHEPIADSPVPDGGDPGPTKEQSPETYGRTKVACETAVRDAIGESRAFVVRPGLITGPGDPMDRFGYWPARFRRGGRVVVPETQQPIQHIDVRDLAAWIVDAGERRLTGTYDAVGPVRTLGTFLDEIADLAAADGTEPVPIPEADLVEAGVRPWAGPKSLPLWLPGTHHGLASHDPEPASAAGLAIRPLVETVRAALADEDALGFDRPRRAGLTAEEEAELLR